MENRNGIKATSLVGQPLTALQEQLTPRQLEVLMLLCEGLPNKLIARRLNIASGTVKVHVVQVLRVMNVSSRLQAVIAVRSLGIVDGSYNLVPMQRETVSALGQPNVNVLGKRVDDHDALRLRAAVSNGSLATA